MDRLVPRRREGYQVSRAQESAHALMDLGIPGQVIADLVAEHDQGLSERFSARWNRFLAAMEAFDEVAKDVLAHLEERGLTPKTSFPAGAE